MRKIFILFTFLTAVFTNPAFASKSLSLDEAYRLALKRSESLAIQAEEIHKAQARFYRAFDYFLPTVSFEMTRFRQDVGKGRAGTSGIDTGRRSTPTDKFTFSQPLFSGFKEFAAIQGSGADKAEQKFRLQRAKELLFVDVMESFYELLRIQKQAEILQDTQKLLQDRLKELEGRMRLGRSRESDGKSSTADLKLVEADLLEIKAAETTAKNLLEFYIGEALGERSLEDRRPDGPVSEISNTIGKVAARSDVRAEEQALIVAEKNVVAAQADLFPTVSLDGNYYTRRIGSQSGNDWDATVTFEVPVFEVGKTLGDIKEAVAGKDAAKFMAEESRRAAELDVKDSYERLRSSVLEEKALEEAALAAKENYDLLTEDYRHNLVNNLEVLDALRRYKDVQRRYHDSSYQNRKNYWKLQAALGDVPYEL